MDAKPSRKIQFGLGSLFGMMFWAGGASWLVRFAWQRPDEIARLLVTLALVVIAAITMVWVFGQLRKPEV